MLLVVEASERSGSLITARWALEQGRSVFVVPGRVDEAGARGGLRLLADGATPALDPEDLLDELAWVDGSAARSRDEERLDRGSLVPPEASPERGLPRSDLPGEFGTELSTLFVERDAWTTDALVERLAATPGRVLVALVELELEGHLARDAMGDWIRSR